MVGVLWYFYVCEGFFCCHSSSSSSSFNLNLGTPVNTFVSARLFWNFVYKFIRTNPRDSFFFFFWNLNFYFVFGLENLRFGHWKIPSCQILVYQKANFFVSDCFKFFLKVLYDKPLEWYIRKCRKIQFKKPSAGKARPTAV